MNRIQLNEFTNKDCRSKKYAGRFAQPWLYKGMIYATDGRVLIRLDKQASKKMLKRKTEHPIVECEHDEKTSANNAQNYLNFDISGFNRELNEAIIFQKAYEVEGGWFVKFFGRVISLSYMKIISDNLDEVVFDKSSKDPVLDFRFKGGQGKLMGCI